MHSRKEELLVYIIGGIGVLAIFTLNFKAGFSFDSCLSILKDLAPLFVSIMIFYMVNGLLHSFDFTKATNKVVSKIRQHFKGVLSKEIVRNEKENAEECLFFANPQVSFIPIEPLRKNGELEIRITHGTLANFETISRKDTAENEIRISEKKKLVKENTLKTLQKNGAKFEVLEDKDSAVRIQLLPQSNYERILENVISDTIKLLKDNPKENI